ncbi:MAG: DUF3084 domain-containing protein [Synergistaceae bacterium]|jgi:uncharacterized protein (DUF3084 family)|nr:DUF3084 domain-containing protein [Synergistaceae bacterium]
MPFNLSEFNWPLVIIIAAISATMSYVGDILGKKIGKKRISILRLRPRYTSTLITIVTGIAVAILTLIAAAYSSDSVKMAIFGPNIMARRMTELTNEVRERRNELDDMTLELVASQSELSSIRAEKQAAEEAVASLRQETSSLKRGLAEMKEGRVIVFQGEMLAQTSLESGESGYDTDAAVETLVGLSGDYLSRKITESWEADALDAPDVVVTKEMRDIIDVQLRSASGRKVLRLVAPSNIVMGQTLEGVVNIFDSNLVFEEGEVLIRERLSGFRTHEDAADALYTMLKYVNRAAVSKGILPDPFSGTVGNLDSLDFYGIVDQIVDESGDESRVVTILAASDIYTEGPVRVRIEVGEERAIED